MSLNARQDYTENLFKCTTVIYHIKVSSTLKIIYGSDRKSLSRKIPPDACDYVFGAVKAYISPSRIHRSPGPLSPSEWDSWATALLSQTVWAASHLQHTEPCRRQESSELLCATNTGPTAAM